MYDFVEFLSITKQIKPVHPRFMHRQVLWFVKKYTPQWGQPKFISGRIATCQTAPTKHKCMISSSFWVLQSRLSLYIRVLYIAKFFCSLKSIPLRGANRNSSRGEKQHAKLPRQSINLWFRRDFEYYKADKACTSAFHARTNYFTWFVKKYTPE